MDTERERDRGCDEEREKASVLLGASSDGEALEAAETEWRRARDQRGGAAFI